MSAMQNMMQGGGGGGNLESMMKNMDPNMLKMAQNMMMNNPSMMAKARE